MFWRYLRWRRGYFAAGLAMFGLMSLIFALYSLPWAALGYAFLTGAFLGIAALALDLARMRRRARALSDALRSVRTGDTLLPEADAFPEADWREIAAALDASLRRERRAAEESLTEMAEYYTTWAHQIKTPLAAMLLRLQGEDTPLSRTLTQELTRVEQYVEMALTFARLDAPSTDYVFRPCALDDVLRAAIRRFSGEFIDRRLRLSFVPGGVQAVTDEKWLGFVVEQVLSNALKYTLKGEIFLAAQPGPRIVVRDTGIGIAPEDLPRVFEKGYTGFNGRAHQRASGVGLYLCRRVCRNLGARISVTSQLGRGTEVVIDLTQRPASGD